LRPAAKVSTVKAGSTSRVLDVFISTTAADLATYRDAVHDALTTTGLFFCTSQKTMVAHDAQAEDFCRNKAAAADIFVGLVGFRRGWEPEGDNAKRSITEIEHDVARESGRRRYIWVAPEGYLAPTGTHEPEPRALYRRQLAFRKRVMASGERIVSQKGFDAPVLLAAYGNLGVIHQTRGDLDRAEEAHGKSLAFYEELGGKEGMARAYANL
jgi:uncharacterized protein DUF4062/tetratricopeptide repeat protein